jgi:thiol-disulfide isomerase/thioredoxin
MRTLQFSGRALATASVLALGFVCIPASQAPARAAGETSAVSATDGRSLKKAIEAHKGKVVVVNLWATWCAPCVDEFPDLVKLHVDYREKGLVVIAVSVDEPEDMSKVVSFISGQKAEFPVYVRAKGSVDAFINPLDRGWSGIVPTTYVFDKNGKRVGKPIAGKRTYEQFQTAVEPLLK